MRTQATFFLSLLLLILSVAGYSQMRTVYTDSVEGNEIYKISFYSEKEGFVAFRDWIGFTSDSGHTFTRKAITLTNVDYNGYWDVNLTFGFGINGVKAFDKNTLIVYGDYGLVPAILYSVNGGTSFKLVYHDQYNPLSLTGGITDMIFPQNATTGYAIDADRVLKTTNKGLTWSPVKIMTGSYFSYLDAPDDYTVYAFSSGILKNKLIKTSDGGNNWQTLTIPALTDGMLFYATFLNSNTGWITMTGNNGEGYVYKTTNGGSNWTLQNNPLAASFAGIRMKFIDNNTGYALSGLFKVYKTTDGGAVWEPLQKNNSFAYLNYSHNDLHFYSTNQFWAGGGHGFLEITTNGGGTPLPRAYFIIDSTGFAASGKISLVNHSKSNYSYQWLVNSTPIATTFNASYTHNVNSLYDTVRLIVSDGIFSDTAVRYQSFYPPVSVASFTPTTGATGTEVIITGTNFAGTKAVYFGNVAASSFSMQSSTTIKAIVGSGATGSVRVVTATGSGSLPGFTFIPAPSILTFLPTSATAGTTVTITGSNFTNASAVSFGGVPATSFTVVSDTKITAIVPSGNDGSVVVKTPGGVATLTGFVAIPTISSFTPTKGTQGTVMKITGTSFSDTLLITVGGIRVLSYKINSSVSVTAIVGAGSSGDVVVTRPGGHSSKGTFTWFPPPVITSFTPQAGPVGSSITITGTGFNEGIANNVVYIGGIKAIINSASATSINITIPTGAVSGYITVNSNNLIAYSPKSFSLIFAEGGTIDTTSFKADTLISTNTNGASGISSADLDGDGKTDIIISKYGYYSIDNGLLIYRNVSTGSKPVFASPLDLTGFDYGSVTVADIDGDGKPDIISKTTILRNTSVPGNLSFVNSYSLSAANSVSGTAVKDVDGDGKPDIVTSTYPAGLVGVFRNISEPGAIDFAAPVSFAAGGGRNILLEDLNNDRKPDLIIPDAVENKFVVMKNSCTKGNISFTGSQIFPGYTHASVSTADFDGDGKSDLVFAGNDKHKAAVFRNITNGGTIQFDTVKEFDATSAPEGITTEDFDGDGRPDIGLNLLNYNLQILKNTTVNGNVSFAQPVRFTPGDFRGFHYHTAGDFNKDGKPDLAVISEPNRSLTIYMNHVKPAPFITSFSPTIGESGTVVTITGSNFSNVSAVSFGGVPAASYTVNSTTEISAIVGDGASGALVVTNNYGSAVSYSFVYKFPPLVTSIAPASGPAGTIVTITGNYFDSIASKNIVRVGGIKAPVINASKTSLTISIPAGIKYDDLSVTTDGLTAWAPTQFNLTFPGGPAIFSSALFDPPILRNEGTLANMADIDDDGKNDLVLAYGNSLAISRNNSTAGVINFASNVLFPLGFTSSRPEVADLDGDGKPDIIVFSNSSVNIFRNTSTPGVITLASPAILSFDPAIVWPREIKVRDIDLDGKPEIVLIAYSSKSVTIYRNNSNAGVIKFEQPVNYGLFSYGNMLDLKDLDGDGKPEIVATATTINVYPNISVPGSIRFANRKEYPGGNWPTGIATTDMDGNGKQDIVVSNINGSDIHIYPNNCTPGNFSIDGSVKFVTSYGPNTLCVGDWDGDGKPDLCSVNIYEPRSISLLKNVSTPGNFSLQPRFDIQTGNNYGSTGLACDIDMDGATDLLVSFSGLVTAVYRNKLNSVVTSIDNVSASAYGIRCYPNPVSNVLVIDKLRLTDKWKTVTIASIEGKQVLPVLAAENKTSLSVNTSALPGGLYMVILENTQHKKIHFKIMKK
ncbi:FG-GAP-like repeat-containing protein [Lacibacter sp.]|uniref:FG-GAP-like repeat-containing protein n=1 Tax=Lacibacter sp. TaxID=1915409 RepID=UPI002B4B09A0|nr:FG-GAP-like repeat-containing protein [Lacibacter sp.]HLP37437.1 FG-GAP-like repeat-containing protein [Lacibacter sp.]